MRTKLDKFLTFTALIVGAQFSAACSQVGDPIASADAKADSGHTNSHKLDASNTEHDKTTQTTSAPVDATDAAAMTLATSSEQRDAGHSVTQLQDADSSPDATADGAVLGVDLKISSALLDPAGFADIEVAGTSCEIQDGCYGGSGQRTIIPFELTITNAGNTPLEIGAPWENENFYLSACASQYLTTNFVTAEVLSGSGEVLAVRRLPTSCIADTTSNTYSCSLQGLEAGGVSEQPTLACQGLDVTGLAAGAYTVRFTINADGRFTETDSSNNSFDVVLEKPECDDTLCGGVCCPENAQCIDNVCSLPDLRANKDAVERSLIIQKQTFGENSCEIAEMCITGPGKRRLLQFEGRIENAGTGDLNPGPEQGNPLFEHSECHGHYHFLDFTDYKLLATDGTVASQGHKQSFCLVDMEPVEEYTGPAYGYPPVRPEPGPTGCSYLSAGWADIYGVGTPCQWVDITDVPAGDYVLQVAVNPAGKIAESNIDNNVIQVPVTIPPDTNCEDEEVCGDIVDQDCDGSPDFGDSDCHEQLCCGSPDDVCNLGNNWYCDCNGEPAWEHHDCNSYGGEEEYPVPECCNEEDSCGWEHDGVCDCNGDFAWDELDCDNGYYPNPCCTEGNYCGYENDGYCDCNGEFEWDSDDCSASFPEDSGTTTGPTTSPLEAGAPTNAQEAGLQTSAPSEAGPNPADGAIDAP